MNGVEEKKFHLDMTTKICYGLGHIMNDIGASIWYPYALIFFKLGFSSRAFLFILLGISKVWKFKVDQLIFRPNNWCSGHRGLWFAFRYQSWPSCTLPAREIPNLVHAWHCHNGILLSRSFLRVGFDLHRHGFHIRHLHVGRDCRSDWLVFCADLPSLLDQRDLNHRFRQSLADFNQTSSQHLQLNRGVPAVLVHIEPKYRHLPGQKWHYDFCGKPFKSRISYKCVCAFAEQLVRFDHIWPTAFDCVLLHHPGESSQEP